MNSWHRGSSKKYEPAAWFVTTTLSFISLKVGEVRKVVPPLWTTLMIIQLLSSVTMGRASLHRNRMGLGAEANKNARTVVKPKHSEGGPKGRF
jgi:hypothetical protein